MENTDKIQSVKKLIEFAAKFPGKIDNLLKKIPLDKIDIIEVLKCRQFDDGRQSHFAFRLLNEELPANKKNFSALLKQFGKLSKAKDKAEDKRFIARLLLNYRYKSQLNFNTYIKLYGFHDEIPKILSEMWKSNLELGQILKARKNHIKNEPLRLILEKLAIKYFSSDLDLIILEFNPRPAGYHDVVKNMAPGKINFERLVAMNREERKDSSTNYLLCHLFKHIPKDKLPFERIKEIYASCLSSVPHNDSAEEETPEEYMLLHMAALMLTHFPDKMDMETLVYIHELNPHYYLEEKLGRLARLHLLLRFPEKADFLVLADLAKLLGKKETEQDKEIATKITDAINALPPDELKLSQFMKARKRSAEGLLEIFKLVSDRIPQSEINFNGIMFTRHGDNGYLYGYMISKLLYKLPKEQLKPEILLSSTTASDSAFMVLAKHFPNHLTFKVLIDWMNQLREEEAHSQWRSLLINLPIDEISLATILEVVISDNDFQIWKIARVIPDLPSAIFDLKIIEEALEDHKITHREQKTEKTWWPCIVKMVDKIPVETLHKEELIAKQNNSRTSHYFSKFIQLLLERLDSESMFKEEKEILNSFV